MTSQPRLYAHYACHRLIDECRNLHGPSVVTIDKQNHTVVKCKPFDHTESPFTNWIGGTVVLGDSHIPPLLSGHKLSDYIGRKSATPTSPTPLLVAWYTPLTDIHSPLPAPLMRIEEVYI